MIAQAILIRLPSARSSSASASYVPAGSSLMLARVAASERSMISSASASMSSRPWRSHSDLQPLGPDLTRRHLGVEVAGHVVGLTDVGEDELPHVVVALACHHQPADRDPQALLEHVAAAGADAVAADVGVVDRRAEEGDHPAARGTPGTAR